MEPKKYWWLLIQDNVEKWSRVTDMHPFLFMSVNFGKYSNVTLLNWKIISESEYNLWNQINNMQ